MRFIIGLVLMALVVGGLYLFMGGNPERQCAISQNFLNDMLNVKVAKDKTWVTIESNHRSPIVFLRTRKAEEMKPFLDSYEANDTQAAAAAITVGNYPSLLIAGNDDWFKVDLAAGQSVTIRIDFDHSAGDLDLALHKADGARIDRSQGTSNTETITYTAAAAETVFIRAYGYSGARGGYTLDVR